jgi:choline dehydrogenase-like flavoprotein
MHEGSALADVLRATPDALLAGSLQDAVVVGAGAAGGLAAMILAEAGLRVLVLDASSPASTGGSLFGRLTGRLVSRVVEPNGLKLLPAALIPTGRRAVKLLGRWRQPIQSLCYAWELAPNAFVDDLDCPYVTASNRPFFWIRARLLGGRMVIPGHGRQYYRLSPFNLAPADGLSPPWPVHPAELDRWYAFVERRLGLAGMYDGLSWLPDSELTKLLEPTAAEVALQRGITLRWPNVKPTLSRYAPPLAALEAAALTGRLLCRQNAIVREIEVDSSGHVRGVVWVDAQRRTEQRASAPVVFLCASALESTRLLLLSRSPKSPNGLGAASGALGRYLMDHVVLKAEGIGPGMPPGAPIPEEGRCIYVPRFDARELPQPDSKRGFGVQLYKSQVGGGQSYVTVVSFAEMLPRWENFVTLDPNRRDAWGIPVLRIDCCHRDAELAQARDQVRALRELAEIAHVKINRIDAVPQPPGIAVHECGTARMGTDPADSVLDPYNQCWEARGLYVTDGSCFPSQGSQNPTLTILALTARACDHALRSRASTSAGIGR